MKATVLDLENRITLLRGRASRENSKLIKKLERRIRALQSKEI